MKNINKYYNDVTSIAEDVGIKFAPLETILSIYPDEFLGSMFYDLIKNKANEVRNKYSIITQNNLIKSFQSHDWKFYSDIYGHNGLARGGSCKKCKRKIKLPLGDFTDDFILSYHFIYGRFKRFGGRITKCKSRC